MADASKNSGSVTQPARLQLKELNTRSAKIGSWEVACFHPKMDEWSWTDKNTQQTKQGAAFRCLLVSLQDPSQYVAAQLTMRSANRDPLKAAEKRFIENTTFLMTSVQFQTNVKQEYMHTPLKCMVQIASSKFDPLLKSKDNQSIQAQPGMPIREVKQLMQHQRFDITALVASVGEMRNATQERGVVKVTIIDDSAAESTVQELTWSLWTNINPTKEERATIDILRENIGTNKPISFFALDGKKQRTVFMPKTRKT